MGNLGPIPAPGKTNFALSGYLSTTSKKDVNNYDPKRNKKCAYFPTTNLNFPNGDPF